MNDKQLENYPVIKKAYPLEMSEDDNKQFQEELTEFLKTKLGQRAYACTFAYQIKVAENDQLFQHATIGLGNPAPIMNTIGCLKSIAQDIQNIFSLIATPMQAITPENNPVIQPKQDAKTKEPNQTK